MRLSTGIEGLDEVLKGGLIPARTYLVYGEAGTGKTAFGLHFLAASTPSLLISLAQAEQHIRSDAQSIGLDLSTVSILDLTPSPQMFSEMEAYDIFSPAEVEREPLTREIFEAIEKTAPQRIFVDGFGNFRHLANDPFQYRRLVQSFFRFVTARGTTLLIGSNDRDAENDADGVFHVENDLEGKTIRVTKFRGSDFRPGRHAMTVTSQGLQIMPNAA